MIMIIVMDRESDIVWNSNVLFDVADNKCFTIEVHPSSQEKLSKFTWIDEDYEAPFPFIIGIFATDKDLAKSDIEAEGLESRSTRHCDPMSKD